MSITRILVPVDFSEDSLNALAYARDLGKRFGAELVILHVVEPVYVVEPYLGMSSDVGRILDDQRHIAKAELARIGARIKKQEQRVRTIVEFGVPAPIIVGTAQSIRTNLIVIATHGRTGLAHALIGSVAEKVVRTATCPVLTVRRAAGKRNEPKRTAGGSR
ncbi:MAG: universal stress protein [Candidatus Binatia bacterium]